MKSDSMLPTKSNKFENHNLQIIRNVRVIVICLLSLLIPFDFIYLVIKYFGYEYFLWRLPLYFFLTFQFCINLYLFNVKNKDNNLKEWESKLGICNSIENKNSLNELNIDNSVKEDLLEKNDRNTKVKGRLNFCDKCNVKCYIRSQHCPICDICVLRKDHHCFFFGRCVGISNHRYFFLTCFWLSLGCGYILTYYYSILDKIVFSSCQWKWTYLFNTFGFITSCVINVEESISNNLLMIILYLHLIAFFTGTIFGILHLYYILKGITSFNNILMSNKKFDIKPDGKTINERLRFIFGNHWYINILLPNYWEEIIIEKDMIDNIFFPLSLDD
uniref:Palmitoyltransferase n=1 Tax=Strongyloides stercoralis TaxID=6248 RepID=A0A0K0E0Y9_STRER